MFFIEKNTAFTLSFSFLYICYIGIFLRGLFFQPKIPIRYPRHFLILPIKNNILNVFFFLIRKFKTVGIVQKKISSVKNMKNYLRNKRKSWWENPCKFFMYWAEYLGPTFIEYLHATDNIYLLTLKELIIIYIYKYGLDLKEWGKTYGTAGCWTRALLFTNRELCHIQHYTILSPGLWLQIQKQLNVYEITRMSIFKLNWPKSPGKFSLRARNNRYRVSSPSWKNSSLKKL